MLETALAGLLVAAEPAELVGLPVVVHWSAPAECASEAELVADIESLADARLVPSAEPHVVEVRVEATATGYALALTHTPPGGAAREVSALSASECRSLARAAALIVAVSVAPVRAATRVDQLERAAALAQSDELELQPQPLASSRSPGTSPSAAADPIPPPRRISKWAHRFIAGGLGGVAFGVVPGPTGLLSGWAGYAYGPWRIELAGEHAFARTQPLQSGVAIEASSSGGGASVVLAPALGSVILLAGIGLRAGVLRGSGRGERVVPQPTSDWWLSVPLTAGLAWPATGRVALRAQVETSVAARRPGISIGSPTGPIAGFRRAPLGLAVVLGPEIRLP